MHFPHSSLTSPETWDPAMYKVEEEEEDSSHMDSSEESGSASYHENQDISDD